VANQVQRFRPATLAKKVLNQQWQSSLKRQLPFYMGNLGKLNNKELL
jgi:hypothetical protein